MCEELLAQKTGSSPRKSSCPHSALPLLRPHGSSWAELDNPEHCARPCTHRHGPERSRWRRCCLLSGSSPFPHFQSRGKFCLEPNITIVFLTSSFSSSQMKILRKYREVYFTERERERERLEMRTALGSQRKSNGFRK